MQLRRVWGAFVLLSVVLACTPGQKQDARTVIDLGKNACIIANQALPDEEIARICGIVGPLLDIMKDILSTARTETARQVKMAKEKAGGCGPDGGVK